MSWLTSKMTIIDFNVTMKCNGIFFWTQTKQHPAVQESWYLGNIYISLGKILPILSCAQMFSGTTLGKPAVYKS